MKNNENNTKENKMNQPNGYRFRVYKHDVDTYTAFYTDTTLYGCVDYMKRWNSNQMSNWYIIDEDTNTKFKMSHDGDTLVMV